MYIIGKTGMGKTTLLENLILADIYAGHGCCYVDPHGDPSEKLIDFIPSNRIMMSCILIQRISNIRWDSIFWKQKVKNKSRLSPLD
ncbi:MAG TPA: hypothetical protein VFQ60_05205, partial [Patescibacteria group bacterium]|nr:hypothetical protein [Patescibacteria group bacterium]